MTYNVKLAMRDGSSKALMKRMTNLEMAPYIEQAIEVMLDVEDRPVRGEVRRS